MEYDQSLQKKATGSFGGALLVVGTTVGAGMLSLPLITGACGLMVTVLLLLLSWSVMYLTSLKLLRLCEQHKAGVNFTRLMEGRASRWLQYVFIVFYLLLLYALMSAYTTQGASLVATLSGHHSPFLWLNALIFVGVFAALLSSYRMGDYSNRFFLFIKFLFFGLSIFTMLHFLHLHNALALPLSFSAVVFAWPTLLPSFGFQNIVPVLYEYQQGNVRRIKQSILMGSLLVLVIYLLWVGACLAMLPQQGAHSYQSLFAQGNTLDAFTHMMQQQTQNHFIAMFLSIFINVSVLTSVICTGLSLLHYIKDAFENFRKPISTLTGLFLSFLPPFLFTVFYPKGFILALQYASIFAVFIFVYTPIFLSQGSLLKKDKLYPLVLGSLVIVAQCCNLAGITTAF
jgi:tyrosine-specific transport protein